MEELINFDTIAQYNDYNNNPTPHPLVNIVDLSKANPRTHHRQRFGFYTIFLKEVKCGDLRYGCNYYDYDEGTMVFVGRDQVIGRESKEYFQPKGKALVFHPDFIRGTTLGRKIQDYTFFSYEIFEALHLSESERKVIQDCISKIETELQHPIDKHSKNLIVNNIELFLNYCIRFYDRQFITRDVVNKGILERFEKVLNDYFASVELQLNGQPTVGYCAEKVNLSANYFGDLIKKETGMSASDHIQNKMLDIAKEKMFDPRKSISEIAYELGFRYPQHFTRVFKQKVGVAPLDYRRLN
ncbi:AraC family transcriptional regulator [Pedobacter sp. BMA]|uniref:helix-turn-helix domain-containing protein n=1 Tax=Pedobacter sp. BMA TaxID=1663685 RepID=UPI00064B59AF|nr:helix-turn-helix transcriptional regulator [Pedobacter sp. BMA]KLT67054.1 transcriptional regulator [Pedobacter sp. BMA]